MTINISYDTLSVDFVQGKTKSTQCVYIRVRYGIDICVGYPELSRRRTGIPSALRPSRPFYRREVDHFVCCLRYRAHLPRAHPARACPVASCGRPKCRSMRNRLNVGMFMPTSEYGKLIRGRCMYNILRPLRYLHFPTLLGFRARKTSVLPYLLSRVSLGVPYFPCVLHLWSGNSITSRRAAGS